jgi:hypothetical protein
VTQASQYHKSVSQQHRDDDLAARCEASMREYVASRFAVIDWDDNFPAIELPVPVKPRHPKPKPVRAPDPNDLLTKREAASRLRCSEKTIDAHAASGVLRYVLIGRGSKRKRKMFAPADLTAFIEAQTRKDTPCPSPATCVRRSTDSIFGSQVLAFTARRNAGPGGKRKR